jgi:hypothetical protein
MCDVLPINPLVAASADEPKPEITGTDIAVAAKNWRRLTPPQGYVPRM